MRKEDYEVNKGHTEYEDLLQCNNLPSSSTPRGHQIPAAFMILASGLEKVGFFHYLFNHMKFFSKDFKEVSRETFDIASVIALRLNKIELN